MTKKITLHYNDLHNILELIKDLNPPIAGIVENGLVTICERGVDSPIIEVTIPVKIGKYAGNFTKTITDESFW